MKLNLDGSVASPQDLETVILEIKGYARWFQHTAVKRQAQAGKSTDQPPALSRTAAGLIKDWCGAKPLDLASLDELIASLGNYASTAPRMTITLAAPAAGSLKTALVDWCRQNVSPSILVNFEFNSALLGGLVVRCGSHVYDWSFRRQILANLNKIPEALKHV